MTPVREPSRNAAAIPIEQQAAHGSTQFRRATGIRTAIKTPAVVVVSVKVIPQDRFSPQPTLQIPDVRHGDFARDDFRAGPQHVDLGPQFAPDRLQIICSAQLSLRHPTAVRRGTKKKPCRRRALARPASQRICHVALGRGEGAEFLRVVRVHPVRNVVEQQREVFATCSEHLGEAGAEACEFRRIAVANVEPGTQRIDEEQPARLAALNQTLELRGFFCRVGFAPERAMFQVVLRSVEVGVQSAGRQRSEQLATLRLTPRRPVKAFDDAGEKTGGFAGSHWVGWRGSPMLGRGNFAWQGS